MTPRGIHLSPGMTVALAPKRHVPTPEDISLLAGVGVRMADAGGIKVVGVPVGSDEFAIEREALFHHYIPWILCFIPHEVRPGRL